MDGDSYGRDGHGDMTGAAETIGDCKSKEDNGHGDKLMTVAVISQLVTMIMVIDDQGNTEK